LGRVGKKIAVLRTTMLFSSQEGNGIMRKKSPLSESQYYGQQASFLTTFLERYQITLPLPYPTHFNPEDGVSKFLQNVRIHVQDYTVSQARRPQSEQSLLGRSQNLHCLYFFLHRVSCTMMCTGQPSI
jgi:hypothetical protein